MASQFLPLIGGKRNVSRATHCVARLHLILVDNTKCDKEALKELDGVKEVFFNGGQLQIIYGTKTANAVYEEFLITTGLGKSTMAGVKEEGTGDLKPLQKAFRIFNDISVPIIPVPVETAMIIDIKSLLITAGLSGLEGSLVSRSKLVADFAVCLNIIITTFILLPALIIYSAMKRSGGNPILGTMLGYIIVHPGLMDANMVTADAVPQYWSFLGIQTPIVGFQDGVFSAILVSWFLVRTEKVLQKHIPQMVSFIVVLFVILLISGLALFLVFGPLGNLIGHGPGIVANFLYSRCGVVGAFALVAPLQPLIITGIHHTIQDIEVNPVTNTGSDYVQPLQSASIITQGGACIGMRLLAKKRSRDREITMLSFFLTLFGVSGLATLVVSIKDSMILFIYAVTGTRTGDVVIKLLSVRAIDFALARLPGLTIVYPLVLARYVIRNLAALVPPIVFVLVCAKAGKLGDRQL